ncbi:MAG: 1-deoxy-D-xylulose-5-phosphate reductoisomerase [Bifidobacteriaceae bacterium]|jgi:1-deoxy-D-xylulose-5-phosphate reductoisomerase|nr:1-deoxy-D-xylulose-5-phosphate reductoisomerase [Bifidobacteriaceae bacterium]
MRQRTVTLLGSTGSIGRQAVDVISRHPDRFRVRVLAAGGSRPDAFARQVAALRPALVALPADDAVAAVEAELAALGEGWPGGCEIVAGPVGTSIIAGSGTDVVLNGITGAAGLEPTLAALRAGSTLALANKESLVIGGALVKSAVQREGQIVPVDSEHSAIAQCLRSGRAGEVERLILTASGGPFRGRGRAELAGVTPAQALDHPTWKMGPVVTINSSTLVNKALELIEAHLLFDVPPDRIDVVVHPQSIIHSMVQFRDGAIIAQASPPDMRLPIALALAWPDRLGDVISPVDFAGQSAWTFEPVDNQTFPALDLARRALAESPLHPAVLNGANEVAVQAFLAGRIGYLGIVETVAEVVGRFVSTLPPGRTPTLDQVIWADGWARQAASALVEGTEAWQ